MSAQEQIKKGVAEGAFGSSPGRGKLLDLQGYFQMPKHLRMCFSISKTDGFVPDEVQILEDVDRLKEELSACSNEAQSKQLSKTISEKALSVTLAMESCRRSK